MKYFIHWSISGQCSHFISPENTGRPLVSDVFRGYYKVGQLARNELRTYLSTEAVFCKKMFLEILQNPPGNTSAWGL